MMLSRFQASSIFFVGLIFFPQCSPLTVRPDDIRDFTGWEKIAPFFRVWIARSEAGSSGHIVIRKEEWPEELRQLNPGSVRIGDGRALLVFSGGHLPGLSVSFEKISKTEYAFILLTDFKEEQLWRESDSGRVID